jgi:hypothetical protein
VITNVLDWVTGKVLGYTGALVGDLRIEGIRIVPGTSRCYVVVGGTPVYWVSGGIPVDAEGRICSEPAVPTQFVNGFGFTAAGRLAGIQADVEVFSNGFGFSRTGRLCGEDEAVLVPPGAFTMAASPAPGQNNINWTASAGADQYFIFKNGEAFKVLPSGILATFDAQVVSNTLYTYAVRAYNADGSTASTPASVDVTAL